MADVLAEAETYLISADLVGSPGIVLYSSVETLRPGPVYVLGLNPGGSEPTTLADSISRSRKGSNAYLDEEWAPGGRIRPRGQAILQRRMQHLISLMGLRTRDVPASNLVFTRSTRIGTHLNFSAALGLCLPVHDLFMSVIQPRFVMTYGSIEHFALAARFLKIENRPAIHADWQAHRGRAVICGQEVAFGNVPHMSVWASDKRPDVLKWALEYAELR